jgi:adenine phosphoribosyltransferase
MVRAEDLASYIRSIPDFPKKGILFRDITTLLKEPAALAGTVDLLVERYRGATIAKVAAIEARGFVLGGALACRLNAGFVPIRKPSKLPGAKLRVEYQLEYGSDALEVHTDAITPGERILLLDDLLATGGTARAACNLVRKLGGEIIGAAFLIELSPLNGRRKLEPYDVFSLITYDTD